MFICLEFMTDNVTYTKKERYGSLGSVLFGHFADGFDLVLISYLFSPLALYFTGSRFDLAPITIALTISLVFSAFGGLLFGWVADRYGRKVGLMLSIGIFGVTTLATAGVIQLWQLYTLRALEGLGIGRMRQRQWRWISFRICQLPIRSAHRKELQWPVPGQV